MAESSGDVSVDVPFTDSVDPPSSSSSSTLPLPPSTSDLPLPPSTFSLTSSSLFLYSDQQRERAETTDDGISPYLLRRRKFYKTAEEWQTLLTQLANTRTLYVGNLSFYTTEAQLMAFFSQCGRVVKVIMGLNDRSMTPCGFCFVEFGSHKEALDCQRHLSGMMADERIVRADLDPVLPHTPTYPYHCHLLILTPTCTVARCRSALTAFLSVVSLRASRKGGSSGGVN